MVYKAGYSKETCVLCGGKGYTESEYRPKMVQDGWEWPCDADIRSLKQRCERDAERVWRNEYMNEPVVRE